MLAIRQQDPCTLSTKPMSNRATPNAATRSNGGLFFYTIETGSFFLGHNPFFMITSFLISEGSPIFSRR